MYDADRQYQAYLKGDYDPRGFQSPWLQKTLRRRAEERESIEITVAAAVAKPVYFSGDKCISCPAITNRSASGYCRPCSYRLVRTKPRPSCQECGKELKLENQTGFCMKHKWSKGVAA